MYMCNMMYYSNIIDCDSDLSGTYFECKNTGPLENYITIQEFISQVEVIMIQQVFRHLHEENGTSRR